MIDYVDIIDIVGIVDIVDIVDVVDIVDNVKIAHTIYLSFWNNNLDGFRGYVQSQKRYSLN